MPLPLGEGSENWCAAKDSNLQHAALEAVASPIGLPTRTREQTLIAVKISAVVLW
jgi:hypothetical protein